MNKEQFYNYYGPVNFDEILEIIKGEVILPKNKFELDKILIKNIKNIEDAQEGELTFINNRKYYSNLSECKASICIAPKDIDESLNDKIIIIKCDDPYFEYSKFINHLYSAKIFSDKNYVEFHRENSVKIGQNVVIEDNVTIGNNVIIDHNVVIKNGVSIGDNCYIGSSSYISYAKIGNNVIIHPGVRIGVDGFGFATHNGIHNKIFHIGIVRIGNNVEIGANSTIDRGSIKDTIIGDGTMIDNLVQIGHNAQVGKNSVIVAQVGIAGSSSIGDYCVIGGQVGIAGHITIGNFVQIAAQSGVISNIEDRAIMGGTPSQPIKDWHRQTILLKNLVKNSKNRSSQDN